MTDFEWLNCPRPDELYLDRFAQTPRPWRKLRLYACGCCRQVWDSLMDPRSRDAVEVAERYADGVAAEAELDAAAEAALEACDEIDARNPNSIESGAAHAAHLSIQAPSDVSHPVAWVMTRVYGYDDYAEALNTNLAALADLFRDVFDNPYRPGRPQLVWWTPKVKHLAQLIYEQQTFSRMSELASALEDAGCQDLEILAHCREERIHIKGCWVLDLLLGKGIQGR